jgi:hypothetical protein
VLPAREPASEGVRAVEAKVRRHCWHTFDGPSDKRLNILSSVMFVCNNEDRNVVGVSGLAIPCRLSRHLRKFVDFTIYHWDHSELIDLVARRYSYLFRTAIVSRLCQYVHIGIVIYYTVE